MLHFHKLILQLIDILHYNYFRFILDDDYQILIFLKPNENNNSIFKLISMRQKANRKAINWNRRSMEHNLLIRNVLLKLKSFHYIVHKH